MHASHLSELAGWLAFESIKDFRIEELPRLLADQYWSQSKSRTERWNVALQMFASDLEREDDQHNPWPAISIVAEEIIFSEMLTRVWSAVISQEKLQSKSHDLSAIAHGVLIGHVEARNRVFKLLLKIPHWAAATAERLNRLSRTVERWTDLLLSQLSDQKSAATFSFCEKRIKDFAGDSENQDANESRRGEQLLLASLSADLKRLASRYPANPELNRQIASAILACFSGDRFASSSLPQSALMMMQVDSFQDNAQDLIQQLIDEEDTCNDPVANSFSKN